MPLTRATFAEVLCATTATRGPDALSEQADYLVRYLTHLEAQTIVVEYAYTDADYLDDVANYYVKSFEPYERQCHRLHFFGVAFDAAAFLAALAIRGADDPPPAQPPEHAPPLNLQTSYLGFVVARPLPRAVIGRTVLKTYPADGNRRHYPTLKPYIANVFGLSLTVDSLAFQQQDSVVAACATVALWSAFQKTADLFGGAVPTPAEITRAANRNVFSRRALPTQGLRAEQMAGAIREFGLEPEMIPCGPNVPVLSLLHGYLQLGLPVVLGVDLGDRGGHAVTVTGYSLRTSRQHEAEDVVNQVPGIGLRIDELYVHDDRMGPFVRLKVRTELPGDGPPDASRKPRSVVYFEGEHQDVDGAPVRLTPRMLILPLYHKIRLTPLDLQDVLVGLQAVAAQILEQRATTAGQHVVAELEWSVTLTTVRTMKAHWREPSALLHRERQRLLLTRLPRFMWHATLAVGGQVVLETLCDATGIAPSLPLLEVLVHDPVFRTDLKEALAVPNVSAFIDEDLMEFLVKRL